MIVQAAFVTLQPSLHAHTVNVCSFVCSSIMITKFCTMCCNGTVVQSFNVYVHVDSARMSY